MPLLLTLWVANYRVYGARKLWKAARRSGEDVGRDQVARRMRQMGIQGVNRSRKVRTTRPDETAGRHPDLVDRQFVADRPNALWVTDLTYVPTWSGVAYVCFIVDSYSRMIVGWRCATTCAPRWSSTPSRWPAGHAAPRKGSCVTPTRAVVHVDSVRRAAGRARRAALDRLGRRRLRQRAGRGRQLALKAEPVRQQGPWRTVDDVELATLGWVTWFNTARLHGTLGDIPPVEYEAGYRHPTETNQPVGIQ